jgi:hypothetical protein
MEKAVLEVKVRYRNKFSKNAIKFVSKHALFKKDCVYRISDTSGDFLRNRASKFCQLCVYWIGSSLPVLSHASST